MIANETTILQILNDVDLINYIQTIKAFNNEKNPHCTVGYKRHWHEKCETIQMQNQWSNS